MTLPPAGYAGIYDILYGDRATLDVQVAFLQRVLANAEPPFLDAGCGVGRHLLPLGAAGCPMVGLDIDPAMLTVARSRLAKASIAARLVQGDLRWLPFDAAFGAILCLDSPLALLLAEADLAAALASFRRALRPGGMLTAEVYDYVGTLPYVASAGQTGLRFPSIRFPTAWGGVDVRERHRFDQTAEIWEMTQDFVVRRGGQREEFSASHALRIRPTDVYAAGLEAAGFRIQEFWQAYSGVQPQQGDDRRMIFVAQA